MFPDGLGKFIQLETDLLNNIKNDFPSLDEKNLAESFQKKLFSPRNRILHLGDSTHTKDDAIRCFNIAELGLKILDRMHEHKSAI